MKKILTVFICLFCIVSFTNAQVKRISKTELPQRVVEFIDIFYKQNQMVCWKEGRYLEIEYEINLDNGTSLEFDRRGYLKNIDCGIGEYIPLEILPKELVDFLMIKFDKDNKKIVEYSVEDRGTRYEQHEVEFENGFEFTFSGRLSNKY